MKNVKLIFAFEWKKIWKNRARILVSLLGTFLFLIVYGVMMNYFSGKDEGYQVFFVDGEIDSVLAEALSESAITAVPADEEQISNGSAVYVSLKKNTIWYTSTDTTSVMLKNIMEELIWQKRVIDEHPEAQESFQTISIVNYGSNVNQWGYAMAIALPLIFIPLLVSSIQGVIGDSIPRARDYGTLDLMLLAPMSGSELLLGKCLFGIAYGVADCVIYCLLLAVKDYLMKFLHLDGGRMFLGMHISVQQTVLIILLFFLTIIMITMIIIGVSLLAQSYQQAKLFYFIVSMIMVALLLLSSLNQGLSEGTTILLPVGNFSTVLRKMILGSCSRTDIGKAFGSSIMYCLASFFWCKYSFSMSERN